MFRPLRDQILVKPDDLQTTASESGLLIRQREGIQNSQEQLGRTGCVVAVGPGKVGSNGLRIQCQAHPGDRITFGEFDYPEWETAGERFLVIQDADVAGVFDD